MSDDNPQTLNYKKRHKNGNILKSSANPVLSPIQSDTEKLSSPKQTKHNTSYANEHNPPNRMDTNDEDSQNDDVNERTPSSLDINDNNDKIIYPSDQNSNSKRTQTPTNRDTNNSNTTTDIKDNDFLETPKFIIPMSSNSKSKSTSIESHSDNHLKLTQKPTPNHKKGPS